MIQTKIDNYILPKQHLKNKHLVIMPTDVPKHICALNKTMKRINGVPRENYYNVMLLLRGTKFIKVLFQTGLAPGSSDKLKHKNSFISFSECYWSA
jgi:hypothetical protein